MLQQCVFLQNITGFHSNIVIIIKKSKVYKKSITKKHITRGKYLRKSVEGHLHRNIYTITIRTKKGDSTE